MKFTTSSPVILPALSDAPREEPDPADAKLSLDRPALQLATHVDSPPVATVPPLVTVIPVDTIRPRRILTRRTMH